MYNLVCFPHYTCGGLLCDILQDTYSTVGSNGGINSISHTLGKIGDSAVIYDDYDPEALLLALAQANPAQCDWIGTHCWPGRLDCSKFNSIINITTTTFRSKVYRWVRAYNHYFLKSESWQGLSGQEKIDKERETAKNYTVPFLPVVADNVINIEFAEIVDNAVDFHKLVAEFEYKKHIDRWQEINHFLYDNNLWNTAVVARYYEAELEINLNQHYVYY